MSDNLPAVKSRPAQLVEFIDSRQQEFRDILTIKPEVFFRTLKNAILRDPGIAEASRQSVFLEVQKAGADGLMLDGREAVLTRYNTKNGVQVAYIPMVAGIMKRVRNSGEVRSWTCEVVYEEEYKQGRFSYVAAPDPMLRHEPIIVGPRGKVVAAYSAVRLRDGSYHYEVMTIDQLEAIRRRSRAQNGPWATDTEEMYRKTVIRRHAKRLPVSSEIVGITQRVDALYDSPEDYDRAEPETKKQTAADIIHEALIEDSSAEGSGDVACAVDADGVIDVEASPEPEEANQYVSNAVDLNPESDF